MAFFKSSKKATSIHESEMTVDSKSTATTDEIVSNVNATNNPNPEKIYDRVAPKGAGTLDMVIAFDTTGSMSAYIDDVRHQIKEMIPRLFKDNPDLRLGIVAFGDYCDMQTPSVFGPAYQCMPLTDNENDLIYFVNNARNTSGGDGDEFYELILHKIIEEMPWREDASKAILLIADANPHEVGYSYKDMVKGNQIDWRVEAKKAASRQIKIDTVSICGMPWYEELSAMTNGVCIPFKSSGNTATMVETAAVARSAVAFAERGNAEEVERMYDRLDSIREEHCDEENRSINESYRLKLRSMGYKR